MIIDAAGFEFEPTPWSTEAACAGSNPNLWFPDRGANTQKARAVCAACPVRRECLEYAVRWRIPFGIWGGRSVRERRHLLDAGVGRPRRLPAPHGTTTRYARGCRCAGCREANYEYQLFWRPGRGVTPASTRGDHAPA